VRVATCGARGSVKIVKRRLDRDMRLRPARLVRFELVTAKQIRGEIPPRDRAWRPPERLLRNLAGLLCADESAAQEAVAAAGHQLAAEHAPRAGGLDGGAHRRGDQLGDGVCLLAGEARLLDPAA
jgi:hypothetical protein